MLTHGEAPLAYGRVRGMARVIGVDPVQAVTEGWMSREALGALVESCLACRHSQACTAWLAKTVSAPAPPGFCPIGSALAALRG